MSEIDALQVFCDPSLGDGAKAAVADWSKRKGKVEILKTTDLVNASEQLLAGEGDLLACSAEWILKNPISGLTMVGTLPRKEPTLVMVSDDKLEYLPKGAIIVTDVELCQRQLIRARADLDIHTVAEIVEKNDLQLPKGNSNIDLAKWLEDLRERNIIDGFVISRSLFSASNIKSRRHTLGLQRGEAARQRFLPPPWQGYTLLFARPGFPTDLIQEDLDYPSLLSFQLESRILRDIDAEILPFIGIHTSLRQIGTVLRELDNEDDLHLSDGLIDSYGKPLNTKPRVELMIELLNRDGSVSISVERVAPEENASEEAVRLLLTFNDLLEISTMEHEASPRTGAASGAMLNLKD
ncbi:MAG: hypothetical protein QGH90_01070 [Candidatus Poseidoniaceae archaeon]|jgi:hypothetical protein|nr:hypothetical protein [Candidatus Poseidoniaceae archaeon]MDP7000471.1 hypothetical protein [Candidatus Poseidoniaceae archaeon]